MYTKGILDGNVKRQIELNAMKAKDDLRSVIVWALTKRIGTIVDYRSFIFESSQFYTFFKSQSKKKRDIEPGYIINHDHLTLPAAYDKMGHWSCLIEMYLALVVNVLQTSTIKDIIDYVAYVCFVCNGTSVPWRVINDILMDCANSKRLLSSTFENNLYDYLVYSDQCTNDRQKNEVIELKKKKNRNIGSCRFPRSQYNAHCHKVDINIVRTTIVKAINESFHSKRHAKFLSMFVKVATNQGKRKVPKTIDGYHHFIEMLQGIFGVGNFSAQCATNLLSLFGVVPFQMYHHASLPKSMEENLGPAELMRTAWGSFDEDFKKTSDSSPQKAFDIIHKELKAILGDGKSTENYEENTWCELIRSYKETVKAIRKLRGKDNEDSIPITILENDSVRKESATKDIYYMMTYRSKIQYAFIVDVSKAYSSITKPTLIMRNFENKDAEFVTNWTGPINENGNNMSNNLYWISKNEISLTTRLHVSETMKTLFRTHDVLEAKASLGLQQEFFENRTVLRRRTKVPDRFVPGNKKDMGEVVILSSDSDKS